MDLNKLNNSTHSSFWWQKFINSMFNFSSKRIINEPLSVVIEKGLDVFLEIPYSHTAVYYTMIDGDFVFSKSRTCFPNSNINHQSIYDDLLDQKIIPLVLTSGNIFYTKLDCPEDALTNVIIVPLLFSSQILGVCLIYLTNGQKNYEQFSLSLITSHANQFAAVINNYNLRKEVKNLKSISAQKVAQKTEATKQKKRELKLILDSINVAVLVIDRETFEIMDANFATQEILNCDINKLIGKPRTNFIAKDEDLNCWIEKYSTGNYKTLFQSPNNNVFNILTSLTTINYNDSTYFLESFSNITENKITEETLDKHTNLLIGIANSTQALLSLNDFDLAINESLKILGKAAKVDRIFICKTHFNPKRIPNCFTFAYEWLNKNIPSLVNYKADHKIIATEILQYWYNYLVEGNSIFGLTKNFDPFEKLIFEEYDVKSVLIVPIIFRDSLWGIIGFNDCTKERIWNEVDESILKACASSISGLIIKDNYIKELECARNEAEKSNLLKSHFLAQMSHEIRTPISNIINYLGLVKEELKDKLSEDVKGYFRSVEDAADRIIRTIELLLNMSELQIGSFKANFKERDLIQVLENLKKSFAIKAKENEIDFELVSNVDDSLLVFDEHSVTQIFSNLIDNAIKFTSKGKVTIEVNDNNKSHLTVAVKDTGIGIAEEYMPNIFKPFTQAEQGYTRKFDGNGLGLALVKEYCTINNAQISYKTSKNEGTSFFVSFKKN